VDQNEYYPHDRPGDLRRGLAIIKSSIEEIDEYKRLTVKYGTICSSEPWICGLVSV
jgi:hypothetical protein